MRDLNSFDVGALPVLFLSKIMIQQAEDIFLLLGYDKDELDEWGQKPAIIISRTGMLFVVNYAALWKIFPEMLKKDRAVASFFSSTQFLAAYAMGSSVVVLPFVLYVTNPNVLLIEASAQSFLMLLPQYVSLPAIATAELFFAADALYRLRNRHIWMPFLMIFPVSLKILALMKVSISDAALDAALWIWDFFEDNTCLYEGSFSYTCSIVQCSTNSIQADCLKVDKLTRERSSYTGACDYLMNINGELACREL